MRIVPRPPAGTAFTLRALLAVTLAIYVAYRLELDSPYSAGTTVLIVANASRGAVVSKSIWRVAGSVIGVGASVVLVACFVQAPIVFLLALALWLGACTYVSSILRHFRSYGAVLAGYTVTLIALPATADPARIFELATSRLAVVTIGVLTTALVFLVTDRGPKPVALEHRMAGLIEAVASWLAEAVDGRDPVALTAERSLVGGRLAALDQIVEYAAVEDAAFARFSGDVRVAAAELFAALTGGLRAATLLRREDGAARREMRDALAQLIAATGRTIDPEAMRRDLWAAEDRLASLAGASTTLSDQAAIAEARVILGQLRRAVGCLGTMRGDGTRLAVGRLPAYVNHATALRNGTRAALAVGLGGMFWFITGWPSGALTLVMLGPITGLLAQSESASAASVEFFKGVVLAVVLGFVVTYGFLPLIAGFPLLMFVLLPVLGVGLLGTQRPRFALMATSFLIFFTTLVAPNNPMQFDLTASLNSYVAFIIGSLAAIVAFRVLLPANPAAEAAVLQRSVRGSVLRLARRDRSLSALLWEHLQHQKLVRLSRRLASDPVRRAAGLTQAAEAVLVGRHVAELFRVARDRRVAPSTRATLAGVLPGLRDLARDPRVAATRMAAAAEALGTGTPVAATLYEVSELLSDQAGFLAGTERV